MEQLAAPNHQSCRSSPSFSVLHAKAAEALALLSREMAERESEGNGAEHDLEEPLLSSSTAPDDGEKGEACLLSSLDPPQAP